MYLRSRENLPYSRDIRKYGIPIIYFTLFQRLEMQHWMPTFLVVCGSFKAQDTLLLHEHWPKWHLNKKIIAWCLFELWNL